MGGAKNGSSQARKEETKNERFKKNIQNHLEPSLKKGVHELGGKPEGLN